MSDTIFLFGDSITQQGYNQDRGFSWTAALADTYIRRLNVLNAGLSGYSTDKALSQLSRVLPSPSQARIRLLIVFFGANDSRLPNTLGAPQHVPLEVYKDNLKKIVQHSLVEAHQPRVLIVTPPPVDEGMCEGDDLANGIDQVRRKAEVTKAYAKGAREVSVELGVECLDLWSVFMREVGWEEGQPLVGRKGVEHDGSKGLSRLLRDGLHLTPEGNKTLFAALMKTIVGRWPDMIPDTIPFVLPRWDDMNAWKDL